MGNVSVMVEPTYSRVAEPWMTSADYGDVAKEFDADDWFERMMRNPKFREDYERSMDECDAEDAAGVRGQTTAEVFAELKREHPHLWGLKNG